MKERTYTTEEAAARLGVPANTVSKWKQRGRIFPAGYVTGRGQEAPLYFLDELIPLAKQWQERQKSRTATRRNKG